jgi:type VI secretion system protein ImpE
MEQSQALREQALEAAPASSGRIDGEPFAWIADADGRLGPMLEIILDGRYSWVPFQHLRRWFWRSRSDLRDLVWAPAHITWANGGEAVAFVPSRYPGSESSRIRASDSRA